MAVKEIIKARLKVLYPKANLSKERLDAIAAKLATKLTDESDETAVDGVLNNANDFHSFEDIAKDDDKIRTLEAKAKGTPAPPEPPAPAPDPSDPDGLKALLINLAKDVSDLKTGKVTETKRQTAAQLFEASETLKGLPAATKQAWINRINVNSETPLEDQVKGLETEYTETFQHIANGTPAGGKPPVSTTPGKADADVIKDVVKSIVPNN